MNLKFEHLTSRSNPIIKWAFSLQDKKNRDIEKTFIVEGEKLSYEALNNNLPVTHIFVAERKSEKIFSKLQKILEAKKEHHISIFLLSDSAFEKISTEKAPQGIISAIKYLDFFSNIDIIYKKDFLVSSDERVMILSSLRDPGNLGSVIRSAVAFGIDKIVLSDDCADVYNPKTIRSSMGSLFKIKILVTSDLVHTVKELQKQGRRVFAAELRDNAVALSSVNVKKTDVIIIGNEGHGIDASLSESCDKSVYIPISQNTESLNAAVAAAVFMWEQNRNQ